MYGRRVGVCDGRSVSLTSGMRMELIITIAWEQQKFYNALIFLKFHNAHFKFLSLISGLKKYPGFVRLKH